MQIIQISTLSFGSFSKESSSGSVTVDAKTNICQPNSVVMVRNFCEHGQIEIRGQPETQLLIEVLPQGTSGEGITLRNINFYPNDNGIVTLGLDGKVLLNFGGELAVNGRFGSEDVNASYMLNVNYLY